MELDILAFGAHPDDVEIGLAGTLIKHVAAGYRCGIVDLTAGEMGSNGTAEIRGREAARAAQIIGVEVRECLGLPDGRLEVNPENLRAVIEVIRRYRPRIVVGPYHRDRHPDHLAASRLVSEASHLAGLWKYPAEGDAHRPPVIAQYFLGMLEDPTFVVDISAYYPRKLGALAAHESQFGQTEGTDWATLVNDPGFMYGLQSRDQYLGSMIQVLYGEGIFVSEKQEMDDLTRLRGRQRRPLLRSDEDES